MFKNKILCGRTKFKKFGQVEWNIKWTRRLTIYMVQVLCYYHLFRNVITLAQTERWKSKPVWENSTTLILWIKCQQTVQTILLFTSKNWKKYNCEWRSYLLGVNLFMSIFICISVNCSIPPRGTISLVGSSNLNLI